MKTCKRCGTSKDDTEFSPGKAQCKSCRAEVQSERYWRDRDISKRRHLPRNESGKLVRAETLPAEHLAELFWGQVEKTDACWLWRGKINRRYGYGYFYVPGTGKHQRAHRFAWELVRGAIPSDLLVCHQCDVRECVRPDHLFLGTQEDNMRDASKKKRTRPRGRPQKTVLRNARAAARIAALLPPREERP